MAGQGTNYNFHKMSGITLATLALSLPQVACLPEMFISVDCYRETLSDHIQEMIPFTTQNPPECYDPDNVSARVENVSVFAPQEHHDDIATHIRFLRRFSSEDIVERHLQRMVATVRTYDPEQCHFWDETTAYIFSIPANFPTGGFNYIPYNAFRVYEQVDCGSQAMLVALQLFEHFYDDNSCLDSIVEDWEEQGLMQPEYGPDGQTVVRNLFDRNQEFFDRNKI